MKAMTGWWGCKMPAWYFHARYEAKKAAVAVFDSSNRVQ